MYKIKHTFCLETLCEPLRSKHISIEEMTKEEYNSLFTMNPKEVTCPECIEILKKQKTLR